MARRVPQVLRVPLVRPARKALPGRPVPKEKKACPVPPALRGRRERPAVSARPDRLAPRDRLDPPPLPVCARSAKLLVNPDASLSARPTKRWFPPPARAARYRLKRSPTVMPPRAEAQPELRWRSV
jgi:hypothetical protein